ncbi:MAG: DUF262 domain-containing protein [Lachnospiraceae bacterium]
MDLKTKAKLDTITVYDLMNNDFYIPDYQRGYRWTHLEVGKLLADLEDFFSYNSTGNAFYCMQPLVVFFNKEKNAWEVIDGQQRLTTLYLILNQQREALKLLYPNMDLFKLSYQSRQNSQDYLTNIDESKKNDNIDYYHMFNAFQYIKNFLDKEFDDGKIDFIQKIINVKNKESSPSVKFIWYDVTEEIESRNISSEDKFSDLNIGKIGLTNAELIKALFLNHLGSDESESLRIASEWDNIEHSLQDDTFWSYIYGKDDGRYATRIEFLFDIIKEKQLTEQNDYYTFDKYTEEIKHRAEEIRAKNPKAPYPEKNIVKELWKGVSDKFYLYKGWFENKKLYHIIGYLRYKKCDIKKIESNFVDPDVVDVNAFFEVLKGIALKDATDVDIRNLNYHENKDHKKIFDILTLFNILSIIECEKEDVRFSFDEFYSHSWDIEHVRSQTPKEVDGEGRQDWIACNIEYFSGVNYKHCDINSTGKKVYKYVENFELYKNDISTAANRDVELITGYIVGNICDELISLFESKSDITKSNVYDALYNKVFKQDVTFKYEDNIGNLVLLDQGTNRGYKNAFYPVKRKWIYRREREGIYILPCTKNVFSKNYSDMIFDLMNWNNYDAEAYMTEIERMVCNGQA